MATIQDINSSIIQGNFTDDQLNSIMMAVKFARNQLVQSNKRFFNLNAKVKFVGRAGRTMHGKILKIAQKNITVDCGSDGKWRVPANMLSAWTEV